MTYHLEPWRWVVLLLLALPGVAAALPGDSAQPIRITADRAELDENTGVAVYIGNVQMHQGTLAVTADRLTIHTAGEQVTRVRAEGRRAHYQQQPSTGAALVQANANVIIYYLDEERVHLEGDAELIQDQDVFTGGEIVYDIAAGAVQARAASNGRVRMTLEPRER